MRGRRTKATGTPAGNGRAALSRVLGVRPLLRAAVPLGALVGVAFFAAAAFGVASRKHGSDLVLSSLSNPPGHVPAGSTFTERFTEKNAGDRTAGRSTTAFWLSRSHRVGHGSVRLLGIAKIKRLKAGTKAKGSERVAVPGATPAATYFLIACANASRHVGERNSHNDCRVAAGMVVVSAIGTGGTSGSPGGTSGSLGGTTGSPGGGTESGTTCVPTRTPALSSTPGCFDGDAAHGVFVSTSGSDLNPGTQTQPKRTLAAGVGTASGSGDDVYVAAGTYAERLNVANGVSVFGGYDEAWNRSPANVTRITGAPGTFGDTEAVSTFAITSPTILQLLTLAPAAATTASRSSYGLRGTSSSGLRLDAVTVKAGNGAGGVKGEDGETGKNGGGGESGGHAAEGGKEGTGGGYAGGQGGKGGGDYFFPKGADGAHGQLTSPDEFGSQGGEPGEGGEGGGSPKNGTNGGTGDNGVFVGNAGTSGQNTGNASEVVGFWISHKGDFAHAGSNGHGGGGGGGGGSADGVGDLGGRGGGGGSGGQGGGAGKGGFGGGGSFGIFLETSTGATVHDSTVTAANGGAGGAGGAGAFGGIGGSLGFGGAATGSAGKGGAGGAGGNGGRGGDGGGGAGGPSVGIFGLSTAAVTGTTVGHGSGGTGGAGGNGAGFGGPTGATGLAVDFM